MSTPQTRTPQRTTRLRLLHLLHRASLVIVLAFVLVLVGLRVYPSPWLFPTFPKITHTARGAAGDPLNIILVGSASQMSNCDVPCPRPGRLRPPEPARASGA